MALMDRMIKAIKREKREKMMMDMMPQMMAGIDMNKLMPRMLANMLSDLSADDIVKFIKDLLENSDKLSDLGSKIAEANLMSKMMMKTWRSRYGFEETIKMLMKSAPKNNWHIPDKRDLTDLWTREGVENAPKIHVLYFCNAHGGYTITKDDELKAMSVMMPMGVSIYETSDGHTEVASMNIGMMGGMFSGETKETLLNSAKNLENCMGEISI